MTAPERRRVPAGYVTGPAAATQATAVALQRLETLGADAVILVEGVSDQIAIEAIAAAAGRDLAGERVAVVPIGGAQAIGRFLARFGSGELLLVGVCDAGEEHVWHRARLRAGARAFRFFVCVDDLEDELIRAVTPLGVEALLDAHGDLGSFRTMQKQAQWRDQPVAAQLRRFLASGATRKLRYASVLGTASLEAGCVPAPLAEALAATPR
jgi:hypothetical protein